MIIQLLWLYFNWKFILAQICLILQLLTVRLNEFYKHPKVDVKGDGIRTSLYLNILSQTNYATNSAHKLEAD